MLLTSTLSFCDSVKYIYPRCHPTAMFFVATREVDSTHALTRHMTYSLVLWTSTELKHVLTRLITAHHLENTVLYVVLSNMLN